MQCIRAYGDRRAYRRGYVGILYSEKLSRKQKKLFHFQSIILSEKQNAIYNQFWMFDSLSNDLKMDYFHYIIRYQIRINHSEGFPVVAAPPAGGSPRRAAANSATLAPARSQ